MARTDLRRFRVRFADGTSETVMADSLDEAYAKARRSARRQMSERAPGRKVVANVEKEPGQPPPPPRSGKFHPFGIGSPEYNREHSVNPRTGMPRR